MIFFKSVCMKMEHFFAIKNNDSLWSFGSKKNLGPVIKINSVSGHSHMTVLEIPTGCETFEYTKFLINPSAGMQFMQLYNVKNQNSFSHVEKCKVNI